MGNISGSDELVTKQELAEFYQAILPYLGGGNGSSGGGHIILDGNNNELEQEENLKFSNDFDVTDNNTDSNTEIEQHEISSEEWNEIMSTIPHNGNINHVVSGFTPVGTIIAIAGTKAPAHYLLCNGQVCLISEYPDLAAHFEDAYGSANHFGGDGLTTFAVPSFSVFNTQNPGTIEPIYCIATGNLNISVEKSDFTYTFIDTLTAGDTTITFTDENIHTDSTVDIYTTIRNVDPVDVQITEGEAVIIFNAQESNMGVKLIIWK